MERQTRTLEEIKKGLECISRHRMDDCDLECSKCDTYVPGWTTSGLCADALALIQQLEAKDAEKAQRIAELEKELAAVKRERDAAVGTLGKAPPCEICIHFNCQWDEPPCLSCFYSDPVENFTNNFEWCGVCQDTEVQGVD